MVLTASIGLGAFAASVGPLSAPEPSPTPIVTATPETAATPTPSPTPSPTPEPDKPLTMEASVIQQDVGVTLYVENAPEPSPTPDASASPSPTPSKSAKEDDAENEKTPLLGVAATITLTDAKGNATDYELDTETGTALAEDVTPGDYTLAVQPIEGYTQPEAQTVTVKEKVVYKADVKAVKEKIVQASQVNESAEDSGVSNAGSAPIVNEVTDTVTYADSARTETGSRTSYTAKLSSSGHLLLADGTETPYLPVYQDGTKDLIGAMRDTSYAANTATAAWLPGAAYSVTLLGIAITGLTVTNAALFFLMPEVVTWFNLSAEASAMCTHVVHWFNLFSIFFWATSFTLPNALRAANDVKFTMVVSILSMACWRLGFSYLLCVRMGWGAVGVWVAMVIDWTCRVTCFVLRFRSGAWKTKYQA